MFIQLTDEITRARVFVNVHKIVFVTSYEKENIYGCDKRAVLHFSENDSLFVEETVDKVYEMILDSERRAKK